MKKLGGQNFTGQKVPLSPSLSVKSDTLSSQIGEGAYFFLTFCKKTQNFQSSLNQIRNKNIFLHTQSKDNHTFDIHKVKFYI